MAITHTRGDTLRYMGPLQTSSLAGKFITFTIKAAATDPDPGILQKTFQAPNSPPYTEHYPYIEISAAEMEAVPVGEFIYDIQIIEAVSPRVVTTVDRAERFTCLQDITQSILLPTDSGIPQVLSFILPALHSTSTNIPITTFTYENATHYQFTTTATQPTLNDANWVAVGSYSPTIAAGAEGDFTRYAWVKDATTVSAAFAAQTCTVDLPSTLQFSAATASVNEGAQTTVQVNRPDNGHGALVVNIAQTAGSATLGTDYSLSAAQLSWASGDTAPKVVTVTANADAATEGAETATLRLTIVSGQAVYGTNRELVLTIGDTSVAQAALIALNLAAASPYGMETLHTGGGQTQTIIQDALLGNANAMRVLLPAYNNGYVIYPAFTMAGGGLYNDWAAGVTATDEMCFQALVRFGDTTTTKFFRRSLVAPGSGLKVASISLGNSRIIILMRNYADPGTVDAGSPDGTTDTRGNTLIQLYDNAQPNNVTNVPVSGTPFASVRPGVYYWLVVHCRKTGPLGTDSLLDFYLVPYVNGVGDYSMNSPTVRVSAPIYWEPSDYQGANSGRIDVPYNELAFIDTNNAYVSQNMYIAKLNLSSSFIPASAA